MCDLTTYLIPEGSHISISVHIKQSEGLTGGWNVLVPTRTFRYPFVQTVNTPAFASGLLPSTVRILTSLNLKYEKQA